MNKALKYATLAGVAAIACVSFVACTPSDLEDAKQKMQENGYQITPITGTLMDGVEGAFYASKDVGTGINHITVIYFDNLKDAKTNYDSFVEIYKDTQTVVKKYGKCVTFGTNGATQTFYGI